MNTFRAEFGRRLRALREQRQLTQRQAAEGMGIPFESYAGYERGDQNVPFDRARAIARFFGVSLDYLAGETEDPKPA